MILLLLLAATARVTSQCAASDAPALRLYPWRDEPLSSPVQRRHFVKAPTVFGNTTHFCGYRGNADAADLDAYEATGLGNVVWPAFPFLYTPNLTGRLDDIKRRGMVLVDVSNYVPGDTDNCGPYAPGAPNPTASIGVCAYKAPRKTLDLVNEKLGDSFTGMDNGEQDGRWIGYATQMNRPAGAQYHPDRQLANAGRGDELKRSFLQFSRFFEKMTDDLGSRMSSLNSIWYPHYFAKTGLYTSLGAETAQGLPNAQLFYAFLRGAAKAYGKKWWGNASIWNRWGHKTCASTDACDENGTSLSLLRRLMYSQILYNSMFFGYEGGQTCTECDAERVAAVIADGVVEGVAEKMAEEDSRGGYGGLIHKPLPHHGARYSERTPHNVSEQRTMTVQPTPATTPPSHSQKLTPIGKIQIAAKQLVQQHPDLGAHLTNCAVVFDFFAGFAPPRHLYSSNVYRLWGNLPFDADSYWGHGVLNLLYPGYVDSSYYTSEKGFQVETPYGDGTDILLSDAPGYILQRYPVVIVGSRLRSARKETAAKLTAYVESGGTLVLTADASESLGPLLGAAVPSMSPLLCKTYSHNTTVLLLGNDGSGAIVEPHVWSTCPIVCLKACKRVANVNGSTVAVQVSAGNGTLLLFASSGVASSPTVDLPIVSAENKGLSNPYPMLTHVRMLVGARLADQTPFTVHAEQTHEVVGDELSFITTRISSTKYVLGMANNGLNSQPFKLRSNPAFGRITAVKELTLLDNAGSTHEVTPSTRGYKPNGFNASDVGRSTETTIAGLDMRLFMIDVAQATSLQEIETPVMPAAPNFRALPLPELGTTGGSSMHDSILLRPTFFDHFDTVVVDWRYMDSQASKALIREGRWAFMQSLAIVVDFSSGINLYPDLRLCNNSADDYARSIETIQRVIDKMSLLVNATTATQSTAQYSNHAIFTLHRFVENYYSAQQVNADFIMSVKHISTYAAQKNVTLHLRVGAPGKPPTSLEAALAFLTAVGRPRNLKIAASSASMVTTGTSALVLRDLAEAGQVHHTFNPCTHTVCPAPHSRKACKLCAN
jgi:hypothetical protein